MKQKRQFALLLLFSLSTFLFAQKKDALTIFHEANMAYQKQDYSKSVSLYEELLKDGNISSEVYFNLGNSYFKEGNVPKAIINYERAKKLSPDDEDVAFNLKIASLKVVDRIDNVPEVFYKRWIRSMATILPANTWSIVFVIMIWMVFMSAGFYVFTHRSAMKKVSFISCIIFSIFAVSTYMMSARSYSISEVEEQAIIISSSVYVKSSPDEKGNDLFILHEGTKVEVLEPFEGWKKIRIANGTIGWLKINEIEKI